MYKLNIFLFIYVVFPLISLIFINMFCQQVAFFFTYLSPGVFFLQDFKCQFLFSPSSTTFPQVFDKKNKPDDYQYPEYQPKNSHSVAHTITVTVHHSELHIYPSLITFDFCTIKVYTRIIFQHYEVTSSSSTRAPT